MDNKDFLDKIDTILPNITAEKRDRLWNRILFEIDNAKQNPGMYEKSRQLRERILDIETKAKNKLRNEKVVLKKQGVQCSFCPRHKSDVAHMIRFDETWRLCNECISIIMEIADEK